MLEADGTGHDEMWIAGAVIFFPIEDDLYFMNVCLQPGNQKPVALKIPGYL